MPVDNTSNPPTLAKTQTPTPRSSPVRLATVLTLGLLVTVSLVYALVPWSSVLNWAALQQREFQTAMASSLRAIRAGDSFAILALCGATAAYGFVHALGPGHGKVLLGGAALSSGASFRKMAILTLASSLAQALSAILLVGAISALLGWATRDLVGLTEAWLAPASALAITIIGLILVARGIRAWPFAPSTPHHDTSHHHDPHEHHHHHDHGACGCGHAHGPTASEVQSLTSTREAIALVASIAIRPCTGALFVLVIALNMGIFAVGCLAVITMGLGTAAFNLIVASSGVTARKLAALPLDGQAMKRFSAGTHIAGGTLIVLLSGGLAWTYLDSAFLLP